MVCSIGRPYAQLIDYAEENKSASSQTITNSRWVGYGAEILGLEGQVSSCDYANIYQGKDKNNNFLRRQLSKRNFNPGRDLTFSAPKSVSLLVLVGNEVGAIQAHHQSVNKALEHVERNCIFTRTGKGGINCKQTNNMIVAVFSHNSNRNLDPHLHSHCIVFNLTRGEDFKWRSMDNRQLYQQKMTIGVIYRHELGRQLQTLGYELDWDRNGTFEISGYKHEHLKMFSTRRTEIINAVGEDSNVVQKAIACTFTRNRKQYKTLAQSAALRQQWKDRARDINLVHPIGLPNNKMQVHIESNQKLIDDAIQKLSNGKTVFFQHQVLKEALIQSKGQAHLEQLRQIIEKSESSINIANAKTISANLNNNSQNYQIDRTTKTEKIEYSRKTMDEVVRDYLMLDNRKQLQASVITQSQQEKEQLTSLIRNNLIDAQKLGKNIYHVDILKPRSISTDSISKSDSYQIGDIIKFNRSSARFNSQFFYRIDAIDPQRKILILRDRFDRTAQISVDKYKGRQVYQSQKLEIRLGEQMQFNRSYYYQGKKIFANQKFRIIGIKNDRFLIETKGKKQKINLEQFLHSDYGYVNTIQQKLSKFLTCCIYFHSPENEKTDKMNRIKKQIQPSLSSKSNKTIKAFETSRQEQRPLDIPRSEEFKLIVAAKYLVEQSGVRLEKTDFSEDTRLLTKVYQARDGTEIRRDRNGLTITQKGKELRFDRNNTLVFNSFSTQHIQLQIKSRTDEMYQQKNISLSKTQNLSIER